MKTIETITRNDGPLVDAGFIPAESVSTQRRYAWNWFNEQFRSGCEILDSGKTIARFPTQIASKFGLQIIDALDSCEDDGRVQVTDHGANRHSVQVFDGSRIVLDYVVSN